METDRKDFTTLVIGPKHLGRNLADFTILSNLLIYINKHPHEEDLYVVGVISR